MFATLNAVYASLLAHTQRRDVPLHLALDAPKAPAPAHTPTPASWCTHLHADDAGQQRLSVNGLQFGEVTTHALHLAGNSGLLVLQGGVTPP